MIPTTASLPRNAPLAGKNWRRFYTVTLRIWVFQRRNEPRWSNIRMQKRSASGLLTWRSGVWRRATFAAAVRQAAPICCRRAARPARRWQRCSCVFANLYKISGLICALRGILALDKLSGTGFRNSDNTTRRHCDRSICQVYRATMRKVAG